LGKLQRNFVAPLYLKLTQHDSHGPDDHPKTIDYHHLDMPRDDGMDEHGIDWLYGCHQVGFWLGLG
jgi:predicted SAM-dependent methyltransferase